MDRNIHEAIIWRCIIQIVLCTSTRPDFNAEEVASVTKDQRELVIIVEDMADHLPIEDPNKGEFFISSLGINKSLTTSSPDWSDLQWSGWEKMDFKKTEKEVSGGLFLFL